MFSRPKREAGCGASRGVENTSENRPNKQQPKGFQKADAGQQQDRWNKVRQVGQQIPQQSLQLLHEVLRGHCGKATRMRFHNRIRDVRRWSMGPKVKALFYCRHDWEGRFDVGASRQ